LVIGRWQNHSCPGDPYPTTVSEFSKITVIRSVGLAKGQRRTADDGFYVFAAAFFFCATVPLRGPLRVRAFVCVR
jgi:hypothetical protein